MTTGHEQRSGPVGGLTEADFTPIAANGFGDPRNAYVHSMAWFGGHAYAGTSRHSMALLKLFPPLDPPAMDPWPVKVPASVEDLDLRAQIWRWKPMAGQWEKVHTSPEITGRSGRCVPRDLGYRGMVVFQGRSDREPALYVSSISTVKRGDAARILRSSDGVTFSAVSEPGLGNPQVSTFRSMVPFDDQLFVPPAGEGTTFNSNRASVILRSPDPANGSWETACPRGFGDPTNSGIFELTVFDGRLYAGTFNHHHGYQIWTTDATGSRPCHWTKVIDRGADRGSNSEIAMSMCVFGDALYVGSAVQNGGYDRNNLVGPAAGEIIRIHPDGSWDLVVGTSRRTSQGVKHPLSGMGPGFNNIFAGYIWRMAVHRGWLYASTFDWSVFLPYARRPSPPAGRMARQIGADEMARRGGGFEVWRTRDGVNWVPVTQNGLGNPYNYGARTLVSTPEGLLLGTANPFGPDVAVQTAAGWTYVPNPRGGAEVWLGRTPASLRAGQGRGRNHQTGRDRILVRSPRPAAAVRPSGSRAPARRPAREDRPASVLVTGASGFIGTHVLTQLLTRLEHVRVLALPGTEADIRPSNRVQVVSGGLADAAMLAQAVDGVDTVFHLAGRLPGSSFAELRQANVDGTENLLRACAAAGTVRRFVLTSSVAVYQGALSPRAWPLSEESPVGPRRQGAVQEYGRSKLAAEHLLRRSAAAAGFDYVILRPAICYGVGSDFAESLVRRAVSDPTAGSGPLGSWVTQLLHVTDAAGAIVRCGSHPAAANEVFNLAGTQSLTYASIFRLIRRLAGLHDPPASLGTSSSLWERYVGAYDNARIRRRLGFTPRVTAQEGLAPIVARSCRHDVGSDA